MTQKELIRQEIERLKEEYNEQMPARLILESLIPMGKIEALNKVLAFIDSLPDENNPEPYNPVYDEDYLNEKIAKATKSWKGVDVDAMLAESRGYKEKPCEDLNEAAKEYADKHGFRVPYDGSNNYYDDVDVKASKDGFIAGAEWMRVEMMSEAVEGEVFMSFAPGHNQMVMADVDLPTNTKVKLIIVKED